MPPPLRLAAYPAPHARPGGAKHPKPETQRSKSIGLALQELSLLLEVFRNPPGLEQVLLYGSRAKGTHRPVSDIDLALTGLDDELAVAALADALDELPLPYRFDVRALDSIRLPALREAIAREGIPVYSCDSGR